MIEDDSSGDWRIDDLAQRSGVSVDTIRYYQREGLLAAGRRQGRASVYGPQHLRQLERIKELQARHFSLGAIKALAEEGHLALVEAVFSQGGRSFTRDELVRESRLDGRLVADLEAAGLLTAPADHGREDYDTSDLEVLGAVRELLDLGMPRSWVVLLARQYVEHFAAIEREIVAMMAGAGEGAAPEEEVASFYARAPGEVGRLMAAAQAILTFVNHRSVQRITLRGAEGVDRSAGETGS